MTAATYGRRRAGFTLLELLVVLVIAGLLTAIVPPLVSAVVPGMSARLAATELAAALHEARGSAVNRSRVIDVHFDPDSGTYTVVDGESKTRALDVAITLPDEDDETSPADSRGYTLRFYPDGSSNGLRARLGPPDSGYLLTVDWLLGRVSIREASGAG